MEAMHLLKRAAAVVVLRGACLAAPAAKAMRQAAVEILDAARKK